MQFEIAKIILWPKNSSKSVRVVNFEPGRLNIISGVSRTGKSAIIPIIDYCLGSDKCTIPTGIIRQKTAWFGVVVRTKEGEKLFARREPEAQQATDDMYIAETADRVEISASIHKNTAKDLVKQRLDHLAGLTKLAFSEDDPEGGFGRPSFRDLAAFTFQPQNIVANPNALFYKADTVEHRQKLRAIFPYVLGAISAETLARRHQLQQLRRELSRKEQELANISAVSERWRATASARLAEARDLGLGQQLQAAAPSYEATLDLLRQIAASPRPNLNLTAESLSEGIDELNRLNSEEEGLSQKLAGLRQRLAEMEELRDNAGAFSSAIRTQRDRLHVSRWLQEKANGDHACPVCGNELTQSNSSLRGLVSNLEELERAAGRIDAVPPSFDRELERVRTSVSQHTEKLEGVRIRRAALGTQSVGVQQRQYSELAASRFLGRLESDLMTLDSVGESGNLRSEVEALRDRVRDLERLVSEEDIARRLRAALDSVNLNAGRLIPLLDAERPNDPIFLSDSELTVRVRGDGRDDFLWEIGSGSNWVSYHVAVTLGLQEYFLRLPACPVPGFLVYDQPSQVYFPRRLAERSDEQNEEFPLRDQDVEAVRRILNGMASAITETKQALQVIVLDHAAESLWGDLPLVHSVEDWRDGRALIPSEW
jgi:predicted  nucleic acid-binding Zn-ribbon protein